MIYNVKTLPYQRILAYPKEKRTRGNPGLKKEKQRTYLSIVSAFDIETSRINEDESFMYIWQAQIGPYTVTGRSWKEFFRMLKRLAAGLDPQVYMVFYVHNLSFEFQFLQGKYDFKEDDVFCLDSRRILRCDMYDHFEFRCSYIHSNMKLSTFMEKMGVPEEDQKTKLDYDVVRYPWTPLSPDEITYCVNDVRGLVKAIEIEMAHDGDNLYTIPLTSTGYVRRDVKKAMREVSRYWIKSMLPDAEIYAMLREAFRGGNTHANRYYAGQIIHNVKSADRSSSYPEVQCNCLFPVSRFRTIRGEIDKDYVLDLMIRRKKALLLRVALHNVRLIDPYWGCPYLTIDKSRHKVGEVADNGRILQAEYLETTITDIDLRIILEEYDFDMEILSCAYAKYGKLPYILIHTIESYYLLKTRLKGVKSEEILYTKSKNKLNSIYGMSAQNPVKGDIKYRSGEYVTEEYNVLDKLAEYNRRAFFPYQWGVWTTAHARARLEEGIRLVHDTDGAAFIYTDTDSVKYTGEVDWSEINDLRIEESTESEAYADDPAGSRHYMGVFEDDGFYTEFATLGAKKYAYRTPDDELHITIAGVNKEYGAAELERSGGLKAFLSPVDPEDPKPFKFTEGGGTMIKYNDLIGEWRQTSYPGIFTLNGEELMTQPHKHYISPCATISPTTKTLSVKPEYGELIANPEDVLEYLEDEKRIRQFMVDKYGETEYSRP